MINHHMTCKKTLLTSAHYLHIQEIDDSQLTPEGYGQLLFKIQRRITVVPDIYEPLVKFIVVITINLKCMLESDMEPFLTTTSIQQAKLVVMSSSRANFWILVCRL